jgi:nucleoside-diphosphate-sugar epimerase
MRVFVTGASGFIGLTVVGQLIEQGHQVLGMVRNDAGAQAVAAAGAEVHRGDLQDLDSLRSGAAGADAVIHTAFIHEFNLGIDRFIANCEVDGRAIQALGSALGGTGRPLIVTSGTGIVRSPGRPSTEDDEPNSQMPRVSEQAAAAFESQGVRVSIVRLPQVHDPRKQGLITPLIAIAREKGVSAYVGDGLNRWPAVHRIDAARLYSLVLEKGKSGARYHPVAEEGVPLKEIAESIGRGLNLPVVSVPADKANDHFGWLGMFAAADIPASSALTQQRLGWRPTGPTLISDLDQVGYL